MTPGVLPGIADNQSLEKQIEKQMGCMAGFLQLFDRHQILAGKRLYSTKRLPPSSAVDSASEKSIGSPAFSSELQPHQQKSLPSMEFTKPAIGAAAREQKRSPSPEIRSPSPETPPPADVPARMPLPLPVFEYKEGMRASWKLREAPRLSLDSRAIVDGKGSFYPREIRTMTAQSAATIEEENNDKQRRSPSVVARLMGLDALPDSGREPLKKAELRRSASESRASRDLMQYRFIDGNAFPMKQTSMPQLNSGVGRRNVIQENGVPEERSKSLGAVDSKCGGPKATPWNLKKSFDSQDFFPEPKRTSSIYTEIGKRLKMRGIDEPANDLETLKQILEALQLKGLLHSKKSDDLQIGSGRRNFIYDHHHRQFKESPIVVMRPRSPMQPVRKGNESPPSISRPKPAIRRNLVTETAPPPLRPRRDRADIERTLQNERRNRIVRNADANESIGAKSPSSLARRRALSTETPQKRGKDASANSPKINVKKIGSDLSRSPRNRKQTAEISPRERVSAALMEYESSTESSISASSQIESERTKGEEYKEGRSLLERCDKLLNSIAEITNAAEQQPSPVSVLDSSFYKEDSSPSPVLKRCIDFKDEIAEREEDPWSPAISPVRSKSEEGSDDQDFLYTSEILRCHNRAACQDLDLFALLEKQYSKTISSSRASRLHRRLVFDTVTEILDRKRQLPPWKAFCQSRSVVVVVDSPVLLRQVWSELQRIRERTVAEDLCNVINGVVERDMAGEGMDGWGDRSVEMSEVVLDIERLIFKDLVGETIRDLASFAGKCTIPAPRRKLVF
ncbi:protein LONGIFOLIA 2 [Magnolia sinica]|uniref:protein LONGIFOLIA 2 n=1 Tax=Magnolia sinica TaxID=86752 RepID=UPI00265AD171|nr:protein LONGIFOLIA 2 [Magnolia sinica]